jgi:hypothetical protein
MTFSGFQRCTAHGGGMPSSTVPNGDILFHYYSEIYYDLSRPTKMLCICSRCGYLRQMFQTVR